MSTNSTAVQGAHYSGGIQQRGGKVSPFQLGTDCMWRGA